MPPPAPPGAPATLADFALPAGLEPAEVTVAAGGWHAARWTPAALARLAEQLAGRGAAALAALPTERLLAAWSETVAAFLDPGSPERRALDAPLAAGCRLSPEGLAAGLAAVLGGVRGAAAASVVAAARPAPQAGPVLVVLAGNLPGLAVQALLPALAVRRPAILKSPSAEPLFAPAFAAALARREPALGEAVAALAWRGGERELEEPLLAAAGTVVAYGGEEALADLARRMPHGLGRLLAYGPKVSLAVVGADADADGEAEAVAAGLARDVALFDQRGCLSVHAVYAAGDAPALARRLAAALAELARRMPHGPIDPALAAAVRQLREEAEMRGLEVPELPLAAGTVVVEPRLAFAPSPGLRTVRVHPLPDLARLPALLAPWRGRLQGVALTQTLTGALTGALTGVGAGSIRQALAGLGVSRFAAPGELQSADAAWHNGGVDPLAALGGRGAG